MLDDIPLVTLVVFIMSGSFVQFSTRESSKTKPPYLLFQYNSNVMVQLVVWDNSREKYNGNRRRWPPNLIEPQQLLSNDWQPGPGFSQQS